MESKNLKFNRLERIVKGFANHRRIEILYLLDKEPELSIFDMAKELDINFKTISEHVKKLAIAGLVIKRHDSNSVRHKLTDLGKSILVFCRTLE